MAALAHTQAGAEAFLRYFFDQLNVAWTTPDAHALDGLCEKTSKSCASYRAVAQDLAGKDQHFDRPPVEVASLVATLTTGDVWRYQLDIASIRTRIVRANGDLVSTDPGEALTVAAYVTWTAKGWIAQDFKVAQDG